MRSLRRVWMQVELLFEPPIIIHLASLPTLEEMCMDSHWSDADTRVSQSTSLFSSLRKLHLTGIGTTSDPPTYFLSSINPASLKSLMLLWLESAEDERVGGMYLRSLLSILFTNGALQLQNIRAAYRGDERSLTNLLIGGGIKPYLRSLPDGATYLRSLCDLTSLHRIELEIDVVFQLSDDFLVQLASSLPHLQCLSLVPRILYPFHLAEEAELPTFQGLLALVKHCPYLSVVRLAVRTTFPMETGDTNAEPPQPLLSSPSMRVLELFTTPVSDGVDPNMVAFIMFTFSNLERFRVVLPAPRDESYTAEKRDHACARWSSVMEDIFAAQVAGGKDVDRAKWYVR
ncbi:hypothetical protein L226DRAFT_346055 [Lentinus tigrinus ALCF2SS1-7]|uniref:F-box domain-containing protein n=1 Tax=Lentinus tigrinus ALCF2SS1-6 TaxID=1328759 RepID=A0A5C2RLF3_9APHY|nr:hypothetical protein L227DRAFT_41368 [Lentinus tigrinus ALCF2SS1-6]RPD68355.1 hypothetical protein L226DRAFT_346055 [Lentinus tigrinus ALCF2SS1-7]